MYYFPVNINDRRIHICELRSEKEPERGKSYGEPVFGFLFNGNTLFHTNPRGDNELIARNGENIELKDNYHFSVKKEADVCGIPTYGFWFEQGDDDHNDNIIPDDLPFAIDPDADTFRNTGIKINFKCRGDRKLIEEKFVIRLHFVANDEDFCYAFKGYCAVAGIGGNITDAAIDFGSEASQISIGGARININSILRQKYYPQFHRVRDANVKTEDLWQYDPNQSFYKSAYFVHKKPGETNYADEPNKNGERSFIQALLPLSVDEGYCDNDLILLPNLKLMDILGNNGNAGSFGNMYTNIQVEKGNITHRVDRPDLPVNATNMTDPDFRQNTLRVILCNLMHCILANTTSIDNGSTNRYLRMVMLMPNVYDQKKVYDIVEGLYRDFDDIIKSTKRHLYDGLEVAVISESDAAFLGAITKYNRKFEELGPKAPQKYYLIVDAGKGTTDFSIMHTSDNNLCIWNSLYRGGLPASGHALTYAIYEALWAFFSRTRNINLDDYLRNNRNMSVTREFMECLEDLKKNYSNFKEVDDGQIRLNRTIDDLQQVCQNIREHIINMRFLVEGTHKIMSDKVTEMAGLVVKGIDGYMKDNHKNEKFGMVLLTGRAFMLEPFKEALKQALLDSKLIDNKTSSPEFNGDTLKTICLDGSTNIGGLYWINNNSELICKPSVKQKASIETLFSGWANKFGPDDAFYFDGIEIKNSKNARLQMGLGTRQLNDAKHVYYVGRGLLVKTARNEGRIDSLVFQQTSDADDDAKISKMTMESLFPYHGGSIPPANSHVPLYQPKQRSSATNGGGATGDSGQNIGDVVTTETHSGANETQGRNNSSDLGEY